MFAQTIVKAFPPNYVVLRRHFPCNEHTIFSYGDRIYRPSGQPISKPVLMHESVHGERQTELGLELWWARYIHESAFRFEEELVAHRAEWQAFRTGVPMPGRRACDRMLALIAQRLAGPLYGSVVSFGKAKELLV